jgi:hypothetical protein
MTQDRIEVWTPSLEHGNETSGSIKGEEFLDQLNEYFF